MAISRYAAVTDAVLSTLTADATIIAQGAEVVDGPPLLNQFPEKGVYVGWNGDPDDSTAGDLSQNYHDLGPAATRDETVEVLCAIQSWRGDDDMSAARTSAVAALGALESALRADVDAGVADALRVEMSDATVRQARTSEGLFCEIDFTITATSLI